MNLKNITILIPREVLNSIYHECDKYNVDETGGRLIGTYNYNKRKLEIIVTAEIGPGPNSKRSRTSFFQDGNFQEKIFRDLEAKNPTIEHLGNWHTHHVNGYPTLSGGDLTTYSNIVNHINHNIDFFYALLVVSKNQDSQKSDYNLKHFLFFRNTSSYIEIPQSNIKVIDDLPLWVGEKNELPKNSDTTIFPGRIQKANQIRFTDQINIQKLYPEIKPYFSKQLNSIYWKGKIFFINNFIEDVIVLEANLENDFSYSINFANKDFMTIKSKYNGLSFETATQALVSLERDLYREM